MNQSESESSQSRRLSDVLNPNYEDLSVGWGATSFPTPPVDLKSSRCLPGGPEYLNTAKNSFPLAAIDSLSNPDYQTDFFPQAPPTTALSGSDVFLPAAENLEYLGLGAVLYTPGR